MKKLIFNTLAFIAFFGLIFVSCEKDDNNSGKHEYTPEELAEIARQDSLKNIIPASYVFTQDITVPLTDDYTGVIVNLTNDTAKLLELFGYATVAELVAGLGTLEGTAPDLVQTGNDITFYTYNWSTKYEVNDPSNTNSFGHWFDMNGDACVWGDQAYLFCEKVDETTLQFQIACYPSRPTEGDVYHIVEAMKYDTTTVAFIFNVTIGEAPVIPPLVYPVTTVVGTLTYDIEAEQNSDYTATPVVIDAAAISAAIGIAPGDAKIFGIDASDDSLYIYGSTASDPGYWFNSTGDVCSWGDTLCAVFAEYSVADELFNVGQFPDGTTVGETYTVKIAFVNLDNLQEYDVVINVTITEAPVVYPETTLEGTQNLSASADTNNDYTPTVIALDTAAIYSAIGCGPASAQIYGVNANDSLYLGGLTGENGCWFNASGNVCNWGTANCAIAANYDATNKQFNVFQFPNGVTSGTTYTCKTAFVNDTKRYVVVIALTVNQDLK